MVLKYHSAYGLWTNLVADRCQRCHLFAMAALKWLTTSSPLSLPVCRPAQPKLAPSMGWLREPIRQIIVTRSLIEFPTYPQCTKMPSLLRRNQSGVGRLANRSKFGARCDFPGCSILLMRHVVRTLAWGDGDWSESIYTARRNNIAETANCLAQRMQNDVTTFDEPMTATSHQSHKRGQAFDILARVIFIVTHSNTGYSNRTNGAIGTITSRHRHQQGGLGVRGSRFYDRDFAVGWAVLYWSVSEALCKHPCEYQLAEHLMHVLLTTTRSPSRPHPQLKFP